jgi:succinyl-diaminopimelate desuccinylase
MCNLVTECASSELLFCGHVDVVPALDSGWTKPPFSGEIADGYVWGRGATDMKGGCAAILSACESKVNQGMTIPAQLAFVCDEETGGDHGIRHLLAKKILTPCDCVIAEPTPARNPCIGQKGLCRLEIEFTGKPAHGSLYPAVGVSAIMEAASLLEYLREINKREFPVEKTFEEIITRSATVLEQEFKIAGVQDVLKRVTFNPGIITGGEKSNVVAQRCNLEFELRVPWGCPIPGLIDGITRKIPYGRIISQSTHEPSMTRPDCFLVSTTCQEVQKVQGGTVAPIVQWAASDARHLRLNGFKVIEYGPGEISTLHAINERIPTDSLDKAVAVYRGIMQAYTKKR